MVQVSKNSTEITLCRVPGAQDSWERAKCLRLLRDGKHTTQLSANP